MNPSSHPKTITLPTLKSKSSAYSAAAAQKLQVLDPFRYEELPNLLTQRHESGDPFLSKPELSRLVEWKLKHGTYRPTLLKLVSSNSDEDVRETTRRAFNLYEANRGDYKKAVDTLAGLKGLGPATASLVLSCYDGENVPFFADELFRWLHYEGEGGKGWGRKIAYTGKEYKSLVEKCKELRDRVAGGEEGITAVEVEKAAYVICREGETKGKGGDEAGGGERGKRKRGDGGSGEGRGLEQGKGKGNALVAPRGKRRKTTQKKEKS